MNVRSTTLIYLLVLVTLSFNFVSIAQAQFCSGIPYSSNGTIDFIVYGLCGDNAKIIVNWVIGNSDFYDVCITNTSSCDMANLQTNLTSFELSYTEDDFAVRVIPFCQGQPGPTITETWEKRVPPPVDGSLSLLREYYQNDPCETPRTMGVLWDDFWPTEWLIAVEYFNYYYCVSTSFGCTPNILVGDRTNFVEFQGISGQEYYVSVKGETCSKYGNYTKHFANPVKFNSPITPSAENATLNINADVVNCKAEVLISWENFTFYDNYPIKYYEICIDLKGQSNCSVFHQIIDTTQKIIILELETEYVIGVRAKGCAQDSQYVYKDLKTPDADLNPPDSTYATIYFDEEVVDFETCAVSSATLKWKDFISKSSMTYSICLGDTRGSCNIYQGELFNIQNVAVNITDASKTYYVNITAINSCDKRSQPKEEEIFTQPHNTPTSEDASISTKLGYDGGCNPTVIINWEGFKEVADDGSKSPYTLNQYEVCVILSTDNITQCSWKPVSSPNTIESVAPGSYNISVRAKNCRGYSDPLFVDSEVVVPNPVVPYIGEFKAEFEIENACTQNPSLKISWTGFENIIEEYDYCIGTSFDNCTVAAGLTSNNFVSFPLVEMEQTYYLRVSAKSCKGESPPARASKFIPILSKPDIEYAIVNYDVKISQCSYEVKMEWSNFDSADNYSICVQDEPGCNNKIISPNTSYSFTATSEGATFYTSISSINCFGESDPLTEELVLHPITEPKNGHIYAQYEYVSRDNQCFVRLSAIWFDISDHSIWFTGQYAYCVSTHGPSESPINCDIVPWKENSARSNFIEDELNAVGKTLYIYVNATNCNGTHTIVSNPVTIPTPTAPSTDGVQVTYSFRHQNGGCRLDARVDWSGFTSVFTNNNDSIPVAIDEQFLPTLTYSYCFSSTSEGTCDLLQETQTTYTYAERKNLLFDNGDFGKTFYVSVSATNCAGKSEKIMKAIRIPQFEEIKIDTSEAKIIPEMTSYISDQQCFVNLNFELSPGFKIFNEVFTGSYQYCIGTDSSEDHCDVVDWGDIQFSETIISNTLDQNHYIKIRSIQSCNLTNVVYVSQPIFVTHNISTANARIDVKANDGCDYERSLNIVVSGFEGGAIDKYELKVNGVVELVRIASGPLTFSLTKHGVATGQEFNISVVAYSCGVATSEDAVKTRFVVPPSAQPSSTGAYITGQAISDSQCNVHVYTDVGGFTGINPDRLMKYDLCISRNNQSSGERMHHCEVTKGLISVSDPITTVLDTQQVFLDRMYYAKARGIQCANLKSSFVQTQFNVPIPEKIDATNAQVILTGSQTAMCQYTFEASWSGFKSGDSMFVGDYMWCLGTKTGICDVMDWKYAQDSSQIYGPISIVSDGQYFANVIAFNCKGYSDIVSNLVPVIPSSKKVGCCVDLLAKNGNVSAQITKLQCIAGVPNVFLSWSGVEGTITMVEYCLTPGTTQCTIDNENPHVASTPGNEGDIELPEIKNNSTTEYTMSIRPSNCMGAINDASISLTFDGRPPLSASGVKVEMKSQEGKCNLEASIPADWLVDENVVEMNIDGGEWMALTSAKTFLNTTGLQIGRSYTFNLRSYNCFGTRGSISKTFTWDGCNVASMSSSLLPATSIAILLAFITLIMSALTLL